MRKTSHDGGDSTSITSGVENEVKKSAMKPKKSSLKRNAPNFRQESDDTVIEPLLQKDKQKTETTQSAKYFTKGKTESLQNKEIDNKTKTTATTAFCGTTESLLSLKDSEVTKTTSGVMAPVHNYMNTNVFNTHDNVKVNPAAKTQILVEIDGSKQSGYNPSPLIFTTAKIHTDGKSKNMEPVQMTPVPILSTIEVSMSKGGSFTTNEKKISNGSSVINSVYSSTPIDKEKDEKVSINNSMTVTSPTTTKDAFGKTITTSTNKLSNNTSVQSTSTENSLSSKASKSLSMITNTKDKQATIKDIQKEKDIEPQSKTLHLDNFKNSVTVKTTTSSSGKVNLVDMSINSTKTNETDTTHVNKSDASHDNKTSASISSNDSLHFATNVKTPILSSKNAIGISNSAKNVVSITANKQSQRQKTATGETSNLEPKTKSNVESSDSSAKSQSSSHTKVIEKDKLKDKLTKVNANETQHLDSKSSANLTSNVTSIPTTKKPDVTNLSSIVTTPINVTSKPSTTTNVGKPSTISSKNAMSNINKTNTATTTTGSKAITKVSTTTVGKTSAIPSSVSTEKYPEVTSMQPAGSVGKTVLAKKPSITGSEAVKTTSLSSAKSKTITKSSPQVTKALSITTSIKTTSVNSINTSNTKPSLSTSQVTPNTKTSATCGEPAAIKTSVIASSMPIASESAVASIAITSQNITSTQTSTNTQPLTTISISNVTKTPSVVTSDKPSTINSSATNTTTEKSSNNISSQITATSKPTSISVAKTNPPTAILAKMSADSSSASGATTSVSKSPQGTSSAMPATKEFSTSSKKPIVTKTQVINAAKSTPVSAANNSITGKTTKAPSAVATSVSTASNKHPGTSVSKTVLAKTPLVTSTKTTLLATSGKTSSATLVSGKTTSMTAAKPNITSVTQVSTDKPVAIAGSSVPSSTPVLRPSESVKKGGSKSSELSKDGKVSKA